MVSGDEARAIEPALSDDIGAAIVLHGQRYINPGAYVHALADSVIDRGGKLLTGGAVTGIRESATGVVVETTTGAAEEFDQVVVATGALARQARQGVRRQAGRAGRPGLLVLGRRRRRAQRPGVLPGRPRRLHARRGIGSASPA